MKKNIFTPIALAVVLTAVALTAGGCSSMSNRLSLPTFHETSCPSQIVAVWDPVIRHEDGKVYRGVAARVIFYDSSSKKALRVKGDFDIYVYDEEDIKKKKVEPSKVVHYYADDLKHLESDSKLLGKSYTVWVPWDEVTDESKKKKLSLLVRYSATDGTGTIVMSHQATLELPGSDLDEELAETVIGNPYLEDQKMYMNRLEEISMQRRNNPQPLGVEEWNNTVAEYMITRENRPQAMVTTTINVPGVSRGGRQDIMPERRFASVTDEQRHQAQIFMANAGIAPSHQQPNQQPNQQLASQPFNQVQFQSPAGNSQPFGQQPIAQPFQPSHQQPIQPVVGQQSFGGLAPLDEAAMSREFMMLQQQQQNAPQQLPGNYAATATGNTAWR